MVVAVAVSGAKPIWRSIATASLLNLAIICRGAIVVASAERSSSLRTDAFLRTEEEDADGGIFSGDFPIRDLSFAWRSTYQHTWPDMEFGWKIIVGSIIGFFGGAFGSVGGVGGGGIFLPMLTLIIGFDVKSATAISKCMIMGSAVSTVYYNMKLRHPTVDMPIFDYDLLLVTAPVLLLGISIGVSLNVVLAGWMITALQIVLFLATAIKAYFKGVETWKMETRFKTEAARRVEADVNLGVEYEALLSNPHEKAAEVSVLNNVYWKEFGLLCIVWVTFLALQVSKNYTANCSVAYWVINSLQVPVSVGVSSYQGIRLYKGYRVIGSTGVHGRNMKIHQLVTYCSLGVIGGVVGGLLGQGGGFVMGPVFLELGVPPEVASATAALGMVFSASMSVVEYYLLKRFPVPYALYFVVVTTIAAFIGQDIVRKLIMLLGRASIIVFILSFTIFISAICLGGVGIINIITKIEQHEYMGFENLCDT